MPTERPELSVSLPCYNEAGNLAALLDRYRPLARRAGLELILVDNGSTDDTPRSLAELLALPQNAFARSIRVEHNIGYGHGIQSGLSQARAPIVAFSHADLQCPPEDLLRALEIYRQEEARGPLLVMGRRHGDRPRLDRGVTWCYNHLAALALGLRSVPAPLAGPGRAPDINAQPKLFARELVPGLLAGPSDFSFDLFVLELCRRRGMRIVEFEARYEPRRWGRSKLAANPWVRLKTAARAFGRILSLATARGR